MREYRQIILLFCKIIMTRYGILNKFYRGAAFLRRNTHPLCRRLTKMRSGIIIVTTDHAKEVV